MGIEIADHPSKREPVIMKALVEVTVGREGLDSSIVNRPRQTRPRLDLGALVDQSVRRYCQTGHRDPRVILAVGVSLAGFEFEVFVHQTALGEEFFSDDVLLCRR